MDGKQMAAGLRIEHAVARAVAGSDGRDACARALQAIGEGLHWPLAAAWEPSITEPDELRCTAICSTRTSHSPGSCSIPV